MTDEVGHSFPVSMLLSIPLLFALALTLSMYVSLSPSRSLALSLSFTYSSSLLLSFSYPPSLFYSPLPPQIFSLTLPIYCFHTPLSYVPSSHLRSLALSLSLMVVFSEVWAEEVTARTLTLYGWA